MKIKACINSFAWWLYKITKYDNPEQLAGDSAITIKVFLDSEDAVEGIKNLQSMANDLITNTTLAASEIRRLQS